MRTLVCLLSLTLTVAAAADEVVFRTAATRTPLLELFTSEGCSSCPPAERWLRDLDKAPGLWRDFVPLAWHVDYWDYIGWRDRFATPAATERQRAYGRAWGSGQIYTPCFVLAGREWRASGAPAASGERAGILEARIDATHVSVRFQPLANPTRPREAWLALVSGPESSAVKSGENSGRELTHGFVVLGTARVKMELSDGIFIARLPRPTAAGARAVAAWVAPAGTLPAEQAVGGWLPKP
ncbi:MAG: DUF1223 domain-containing protein [Chthoniobacteraceae bacterium]